MPMYDRVCKSGHEQRDCYEPLNLTPEPPCPECGQPTERACWLSKPAGVISDDIPGGIDIRHAICNADGTPKRYYSKSEIRKAARAAGWGQDVHHVSDNPGTDKSKHTTRWI